MGVTFLEIRELIKPRLISDFPQEALTQGHSQSMSSKAPGTTSQEGVLSGSLAPFLMPEFGERN